MRAEKVGRDTLLAQIVQMVAEAQRSRAPIQRLADQVAGWFVPAVIAVALVAFAAWATVRAGAALGLRPGRRGQRADHRLPLRARACDADVDHGRRRARRAGRRADQERRSAGADGEGRHAGRRQDRHADRRQAEGRRRSCRRRASTRHDVLRLAASVERASEHPLAAADRRAPPRSASSILRKVDGLRFADRQGRDRHGRGQAHRCSATPTSCTSCGIDAGRSTTQAERLRGDGATAIFVGDRRQARRRRSPSPIRSRRRRRRRSQALRGRGHRASSC